MEKVKILHVLGKMDKGGAETFIMNIYRNIDLNKFQFDFIVWGSEEGDYDREIKSLGGRIYNIINPNKVTNIYKYSRKLKKIIMHNKYDVVHSHVYLLSGKITSIAKGAGVKNIISHSHTSGDHKKDTLLRKTYKKYMKYLIFRNSTFLLGCSEDAIRTLYDEIADERIIKVNNAIDIKRFRNINKTRENMLKDLKIPKNSYIVGHIGRFSKVKNHSFLIEIFTKILEEKENSYLILVGKGELQSNIKEKVKKLHIEEKVKFLNLREDIPELLNTFDIFLFPSLYEGLGIVLIEAQALGVPCYTSDTVPEEADMGAGLVKYISLKEDASYWAEIILSSKLSKNKNSYKKIIEKGYCIEDSVDKLEKIYLT